MANEFYDELLTAFGFKEGAEVTAEGSFHNDMAHDNAEKAQRLADQLADLLGDLRDMPKPAREVVIRRLEDWAVLECDDLKESLAQMRRGDVTEA